MFDTKQLLDQFLGNVGGQAAGEAAPSEQNRQMPQQGAAAGGFGLGGPGFGQGALVGGIAGLLLGSKRGRKLTGNVMKYGGMAAIGGLAYKAYRDYQERQASAGSQTNSSPESMASPSPTPAELSPPQESGFDPARLPGGEANFALDLMRAMIYAAKSDGHIDDTEQQRIFQKMDEAGLGPAEKAFIVDELRAPLDIEKVVAAAATEEAAVELYAASRLAIDPDDPAERAYLSLLAARLKLDPALIEEIERTVTDAQER